MTVECSGVPQSATSIGVYRERLYLAALVISAIGWLLACFGDTVVSMISTWRNSDTFAHGFLIFPISLWLAWRQRYLIGALAVRPNFWCLPVLAVAGFVWLLGHLAVVVVVQQYALIFMILLVVAAILGNQIVKVLAFPLIYLLFAVPFGDVLLPTLMEHTADFTVFALRVTGIPVYREGLYLTVPSGNWLVAEACSGLRYLIASVTLGVLFAYLTFRSIKRRLIFVALSIVVPIIANWLRAYIIVMIGHLTSMKHAVGVDHLIYGWVFFGVIMFILFWLGSIWREDQRSAATNHDAAAPMLPIGPSVWKSVLSGALATAGVAAALPVGARHLQGGSHEQPKLEAPASAADWQRDTGVLADWRPHFLNPRARISQVYTSGLGRAELFIRYYRNQQQGAQLISTQNALVHGADKSWVKTGEAREREHINDSDLQVIETMLRGNQMRLLVWHWYWIDDQHTSSAYRAKLLQAKSMLLGQGDDGAVIIIATPLEGTRAESVARLRGFSGAMLPAIVKHLRSVRR